MEELGIGEGILKFKGATGLIFTGRRRQRWIVFFVIFLLYNAEGVYLDRFSSSLDQFRVGIVFN